MKKSNEEFQEAGGGFAKFENPGDAVIGTYVGKENIAAKGIYPAQIGYRLIVDGAETMVAFNIAKKWIHSAMNGAKIGQRVKFLFEGWFETEAYKSELARVGGKPEDCKISRAKTIKVFLGNMDNEFLNGFPIEGAQEVDLDSIVKG